MVKNIYKNNFSDKELMSDYDDQYLKYYSNNGSSRYIARWDDKKSDIVFKKIKDKDFYKKSKKPPEVF